MKKTTAIALLGGTPVAAAELIGITPSAVSQWPDELPARISDRVLAVQARRYLPPELIGDVTRPAPVAATPQETQDAA